MVIHVHSIIASDMYAHAMYHTAGGGEGLAGMNLIVMDITSVLRTCMHENLITINVL